MLISVSCNEVSSLPFFNPYEDISHFIPSHFLIFHSPLSLSLYNLLKQNCQMPISHSTLDFKEGMKMGTGKMDKGK
jgi:hypothetical protein